MSDGFDTDLHERLSRVAAAVPVDPPPTLGVISTGPVRAGSTARRVALGGLLPLLALAVAGMLLAGLAKVGPFAPSGSTGSQDAVPSPGAPFATDRDGEFELTLRADKARYLPNEPIDVKATLAYLGDKPTIEISHDSAGPVLFGIREKVFRGISAGTVSMLMCDRSSLKRGDPLDESFKKGGGFSGDDPNAGMFEAWIKDPVLRLPRGTWHLYAAASGPCMSDGPRFSLQAEIVILVDDDPAATPSDATPIPDRNEPVYGGDDIGDFMLQLVSRRSTYVIGTPIDLSTWYTFGSGVGNSITVSHFSPEVAFSVTQVADDAQLIRSRVYDSSCVELKLADGIQRDVPLTDASVTLLKAVSWPQSSADAIKAGILQLPIGRWRITAGVETALGPCSARGEGRQLHASIEIDVVGPTDGEIALRTGPVPTAEDGSWKCLTALGSGVLVVNPRTGLGFTDQSGQAITDVVWPDGYSARFQGGRAILIDESGYPVAQAGDFITRSGGYGPDNVFHVCGAGL